MNQTVQFQSQGNEKTTGDKTSLERLAFIYGVLPEYLDVFKQPHPTSAESTQKVLTAMGIPCQTEQQIEAALDQVAVQLEQRVLKPVQVIAVSQQPVKIDLNLSKPLLEASLQWQIILECGENLTGKISSSNIQTLPEARKELHYFKTTQILTLPEALPMGYHQFSLFCEETPEVLLGTLQLIMVPERCFLPEPLKLTAKTETRIWGPAAQLYALRSKQQWGIGDFTDLKTLIHWTAEQGGQIIGLNPLHPLKFMRNVEASPYSPSSRLFLNILYLDVTAIPELNKNPEAQALLSSEAWKTKLAALRHEDFVNYMAVAEAKHTVLKALFTTFMEKEFATASNRAKEFLSFIENSGEQLQRFATYEALNSFLQESDSTIWGWPVWPEQYKNPENPAVEAFFDTHRQRVYYYQYLQWLCHGQLMAAKDLCAEQELIVGLYLDVAVGVNSGGTETWGNQSLFALNAAMGAPPDALNLLGQNWGLPPLIPFKLYESGYDFFVQTIRYSMQYGGAVRLDHFLGLLRLFWIPNETACKEGAYVAYPFEDLLGILALESTRNKCLVVGEDLGTVPPMVQERMQHWGVLSYKLLYFEREEDGTFLSPQCYNPMSLAALTTHDHYTLSGFWSAHAFNVRAGLNLFPTPEIEQAFREELVVTKQQFFEALKNQELLPETACEDTEYALTPAVCTAIYQYVAKTPCRLAVFQFEDVFEQLDQVNLPGTFEEHPNWNRKLPVNLEDFNEDARLNLLCKGLREIRN